MMMKENRVKKWIAKIAVCGAAVLTVLTGTVQYYARSLPDHYYTQPDRPLTVSAVLPVTASRIPTAAAGVQEAELRLFGILPVKTVSLTAVAPVQVYAGGEPFGIRMLMAGAMVVSLSEISTPSGSISPAAEAGIEAGDIIQEIDGIPVSSSADLQRAVSASEGQQVRVTYLRGSDERTVPVQPVWSASAKRWQTGMWVRDSTAGIGTVTYYLPAPTGGVQFAGLGHAVCDPDTGERIPLGSGDVIPVTVSSVTAGRRGTPGELHGQFHTAQSIGTLQSNDASGVYGVLSSLPPHQELLPLGFRQDISCGEAMIYTTVRGDTPQAYRVEIEEIRDRDTAMRDLVVHVTDPALLAATGGIVQGMSGSPIIQNGRLIGAVTHVFVRDPTRGYGIFAENMYAQTASEAVSAEQEAAGAASAAKAGR